MTIEEIQMTPQYIAFVKKHYNEHRYIDSVSVKREAGVITEVYYDGFIFYVSKELK